MRYILTILLFLLLSCQHQERHIVKSTYDNLSQAFSDTLTVISSDDINKMTIHITGKLSDTGRLVFDDGGGAISDTIFLTNEIDTAFENEWYNENCIIFFEPTESSITGHFTVECEFN